MRELYRPDKEKAIKGKPLKDWTKEEIDDGFHGVCLAAREYIRLTTKRFFKNKKDMKKKGRHTFTISVKTEIINRIPHKYNEKFIRRMKGLIQAAEKCGYNKQFSKWRTTKEYGWHFIKEGE